MIRLKPLTSVDIPLYQQLASKVYAHYFASYWEGSGLENYLENQFGQTQLEADIRRPTIGNYLIMEDNHSVGFAKFILNKTLEGFEEKRSCELQKIYLHPDYVGKGIGSNALNRVIEMAHERNNQLIFLNVVDTNKLAIQFYKKFGFKHHGRTKLEITDFKDEFRGLIRMVFEIE